MSWLQNVNNGMIITTGDGKVYTPEWIIGEVEQEYSLSSFNFKNVKGTLVKRDEAHSRVFSIQIFFQGEDHLEVAERFRISAEDKRHWNIDHPIYGELIVHPRRIKIDPKKFNVSKFTIQALETILGAYPTGVSSPVETIERQKVELDELTAAGYSDNVSSIEPTEITNIQTDITGMEATATGLIESSEDSNNFRNTVREAQRKVGNIISDANGAIRSVQEVVNFPFRVIENVTTKIDNLTENFTNLVNTIATVAGVKGSLVDLTRNNKLYIESNGATAVGASAVATIDNLNYETRDEVDVAKTQVIDLYNAYIEAIDSMQTESQTEPNSYAVNDEVLRAVQSIVFFTLSNLEQVALDAEKEFEYTVEADTNPIVLANRFYGLDEEDLNLEKFINTNQIGMNELLNIPKGRVVTYYA